MLHRKKPIVDKVKNDGLTRAHVQNENNAASKSLSMEIPQVLKRGRPKNN